MIRAFISSPYTHHDRDTMDDRAFLAADYIAWLAIKRPEINPYSPIAHWHYAAMCRKLPTDADFWAQKNRAELLASTEIHVLMLPGWQESKGVAMEMEWAMSHKYRMPIYMVQPTGQREYTITPHADWQSRELEP